MRRAFALVFVCAGLYVSFGPARAQQPRPAPADPPAISAGALALMEEMQGTEVVPDEVVADEWTPRSAFRSFMTLADMARADSYPALGGSFDAINFNQNSTNTSAFQIPPDPAGAAGPNHVVAVVNSSIQWFTKDGTLQHSEGLRAFFGNVPATRTFDPKVIYDPHEGRFVVMTLERDGSVNNQATNRSRIYVAVSDDSDPNGTWHRMEIDSKIVVGGVDRWADFPGFGVDEDAIYITANMFSFATSPGFLGVRLWIIPKASFYSGGGATFDIYDPVALANANPVGNGAVATTAQPAIMYPGAPAGVGTFLMQYGGLNNGTTIFLGMIRVDNPLSSPTFEGRFIPIGPFPLFDNLFSGFPGVPQSGTTRTIATNDRRISQSPVWRDNNLYLAAPMVATTAPDAGQVTARWFRVNTASLDAPILADTGAVGGEDIAAGTHTFFPTVTVDRKGNMAVGYAASGPNIFPGAYYSMRLTDDAPGSTRPAGVLRAGVDFYVRAFSMSATVTSRWGDYTGISLDPVDEATIWVFNEYALARGTVLMGLPLEDGRWGTAFGRFAFACTLDCPDDITVPNDPGRNGAVVTFADPACMGSCGNLAAGVPSGSFFPIGTTVVTFTATRQDGSTDTCSFNVTVVDVEPPVIAKVSRTPDTLRMTHHKMVGIVVRYTATDNLDAACTLSVSSNEPVDGTGDGDTAPDWVVLDDRHVQLRAERSGGGNGRIYSVLISCTDGTFTTTETVHVRVPKSQR